MTNIVICFYFWFKSFWFRFDVVPTIVTVEMKHPFIIWFSKFVANAEHSKSKIMITSKDLKFSFPFENHLNDAVDIFWFLRFFPNLPKNSIGIDSMPEEHGFSIFPRIFIPNKTNLIRMHKIVSMCKINFLISKFYPN